ncbi:preprotein translocase subunit SecE [Mycobacterium sp. 21AC1]|uniref:preprotein translocase subunit SecE n=1 Tax=[Mycobacterium] appelbergii TaxID=2939269 RepID=UPI0029394E60|nr:preprotein translocase subunit SecE [Mycobacterium sp. 21AC1]MDV3127683.1 preprotein translocase subunit SecE [Mycobacterium sp. 21AC1]
MSDEREGLGSADADAGAGTEADDSGHAAVVTKPLRPTGKRSRRGVGVEAGSEDETDTTESSEATDAAKDGSGKSKKVKKAKKDTGPSRNPIMFVVNYLKQVVAELRKVIWPNRKQMVSYTTVVLVFLAFMVALISGTDFGLARLVSLVFGT